MYIDTQWISDNLAWVILGEALVVFAYYAVDYYRFKRRGTYTIDLAAKKSSENGQSAPGAGTYRTIKPKK